MFVNNDTITKFSTLIKEDIEKIEAQNFDKDKIIEILNTIIEYYKEIKISTNPYLWMELAIIATCKLNLKNTKPEKIQPDITPQIKETIKEQKKPETITEKKEIQNNNNQNEAEIWTNIINAIPTLPSKAFYSGVAKLVKIENKKITLGFLNENLITQAKSDSKLPQLKTAIEATYKDFEIEFVKINADFKTLDIKPKITPNIPKRPPETPIEIQKPTENFETLTDKNQNEEQQTKENKKMYYSAKVQEMIEQFSGKIID